MLQKLRNRLTVLAAVLTGSVVVAVCIVSFLLIRQQYANQGHIRQIQALGHHLGADEHRNLFLLELIQNFFVGIHRIDGICIHADAVPVREQEFQFRLYFLGTGANGFHRTAAGRTSFRCRLGKTAVVAHKPVVGTVVSHPQVTPGAFRGFPAVYADQRPGIAPAVEQQNGLFSFVQAVLDGHAQAL